MKKILGLAIGLFAAATSFAALPVFNATLTMGKQTRFVLIGADGKSSSWLQIGDTFDGYTLKAFDAKTDVLDLEQDGKVSHVPLANDAAVVAGAAASLPATLADAEGVLNKMHFSEVIEKVMQRQQKMMGAQFEQMTNRMAAQGVSPEDIAEFKKKMLEQVQSIIDPSQLKTDMTKIYSEVFTKDELDGMAAFYSTPLGDSVAKKQADVQEKVGVLIQGRMMQAMPKIQQMTRDFAAEQKAKKQAAAAAAAPAPAPAPATTTTP